MADQINPLTGLPVGTALTPETIDEEQSVEINSLTGQPVGTFSQTATSSPLQGTVGMPGSFQDYDGTWLSPATPVSPFIDMDEVRARNQSAWDQVGNGLAKAGVTFLGAVSENTLGYAMGLTDYVLSGFEDFEESMTNNPVGQFFDQANEAAREALPNYQTRAEKANQGTLGMLGSVNFWADTFANGAAYSLGSVASAYLTGGVGVLGAAGKAAGVGAKVSKGLAGYRAAKAIQSGMPLREALKKGAKLRTGIRNGSKGLGFLEGGAMMSIAESAVEAREVEDRMREELVDLYRLKNGLKQDELVPADAMLDIERASQDMSSLAFDANMGILLPTNLLMFGNMLRPMQMGKNAIWGTKLTNEGGKQVLRETIESLPGWAQKGARTARTYAAPAVKGAVTEYGQETGQYAVSEGLVDFTKDEVERLGSVEMFNALRDGRNAKALARVADDLIANASTPEGREQGMVGALVGLMTGGYGGARANRAKDERTKKAIEYFNNFDNAIKISELGKASKENERHVKAMQLAEAEGNQKAYNDAKFRLMRQTILTHAQNGTFDAFIERLEDAKDLSKEDFDALFGIETVFRADPQTGRIQTVEESNKQRIDDIIERAKDLKSTYEMVEDMFPAQAPQGALAKSLIKTFQGRKKLAELQQADADSRLYKHAMILSLSESKDAESRASKRLDQLIQLDPELNKDQVLSILSKGYTLENTKEGEKIGIRENEELRKTLEESVQRAVENGHPQGTARKYAQEIYELLNNRNEALKAFQNLESRPDVRDIYVERKKAEAIAEEQKRIDRQAEDAIAQTQGFEELVKRNKELDEEVSDAAKQKVEDEIKSRRKQMREFLKEFEAKTPQEILEISDEEVEQMEPLKREAYNLDKANVEAGKRTVAKAPKKRSKKSEGQANDAANKRGRKGPTSDQQAEPKGGSDVRERRGRMNKAVGGEKSNSLSTTTTVTSETGEVMISGEYNLVLGPADANGNPRRYVLVGATGSPTEGARQSGHRLNGQPIINKRELLADPNVAAGTEVTLVAIENDWWTASDEAVKADPVANLPIYVRIGDDIVGVLGSGHSPMREAVVEQWQAGNNEAVTTTIEAKHANNFFNAAVGLGSAYQAPYFYDPVQALGQDVAIGVVTRSEAGGLKYNLPEGTTNIEQIQKDLGELGPKNMVPGQVFYAVLDPNGKYRAIVGSTSGLSTQDQSLALQLMAEGKIEDLTELVGTNVMYDMDGKVLNARRAGDTVVYTFNAVDQEGKRDDKVPSGLYVQVDRDLVTKALRGEKLTLGSLTPTQRAKLLVELTTITSERGIEIETDNGVTNSNEETAEYVLKNLGDLVRNIVRSKKYQVSVDNLTNKGDYKDARGKLHTATDSKSGYLRYLTEGQERQGAGHKGILSSDVRTVKGTPFIDIGLDFSTEYSVAGAPVKPEDNVPTPPNNTESTPTGTPTSTRPAREQNPDDFFGGDTGPQVTAPENLEQAPVPPGAEDGEVLGDDFYIDPETGEITQKPFRLKYTPSVPTYTRMNASQAKAWLKARNIPVSFYDQALRIGNGVAHGFMESAGVQLWTQAEVGTEYHEAFHYVFRTLLNDKQRKALYAEVRKEYTPTKEELSALRKLNPNITRAELEELSLEEYMAEEFRDYVFTMEETADTLPKKIAKFFKDMYNMIKAMFVDPVSVRQLYSLIESNKLPKKFIRTGRAFAGKATAFAYNENIIDPEFHQVIDDTMATIFRQGYSEITGGSGRNLTAAETAKLIGRGDDKGQVAEFFLKNSLRYADSKRRLSVGDLAKVRQRLKEGKPFNEMWSEIGMEQAVPIDTGLPESLVNDPGMHAYTAKWFRVIYQNWEDTVSQDNLENVTNYGFRTIMLQGLEKHGFSLRVQKQDEENQLREDEMDEVAQFDKIYDLGAMEFNPMDKNSGEVRRRMGMIKAHEPNALGIVTYINIDEVTRLVVPAVAGAQSIDEMIQAISIKAKTFPQLLPVVDALRRDYTAQEHATFRRVFSLEYTELKLLEESYTEDSKITRIINSNRKSSANNAFDTWKRASKETQLPKPNALFKDQDGKLSVNNEFDGQDRGQLVTRAYAKLYDTSASVNDRAEALGQLMHLMGLGLGDSIEQSSVRTADYVNAFADPRAQLIQLVNEVRPTEIVGAAFNLNRDKKTGVLIGSEPATPRETPVDFFVQQSNRVKYWANVRGAFESPLALSLIDGAGKSKYPYNLPTPFTAVLNEIQGSERMSESLMDMLTKDEFFNAMGHTRYMSLIKRLVDSGKFEIESFAMDVLKHEDEETSNIDYKNASARDSLIMRLEAYANNGNQYAYYALPVQETRGRMDFIKLPRFTNRKEMSSAGIADVTSAKDVIKGLIVQDLIRINRDRAVIAEAQRAQQEDGDNSLLDGLITDYHVKRDDEGNITSFDGRYLTFQLSGVEDRAVEGFGTLSSMVTMDEILDADGTRDIAYEKFHSAVDEMVDNYLKEGGWVDQRVKELMKKIDDYNLNQDPVKDREGNVQIKSRLPLNAIKRLGGLEKFLTTFVINDIVARLEMAKLFRGGIAMAKNTTDFYKRMGLLQTPGALAMIKGESKADVTYGMFETVREASISEIRIVDQIHDEIASRYAATLIEQGMSPEDATNMANKYKAQVADATDAQAYISPQMWRAMQEGYGDFTTKDAVWFKEFEENNGPWKAQYTENFKMFVENHRNVTFRTAQGDVVQHVVDMDKNSYVVLTPELVKGKPALQEMYNAMQRDNIHVINTISAKKGAKRNVKYLDPTVVSGMFNNLEVVEQSGRNYRRPQDINDKKTDLVRLNRQIRKDALNSVRRDGDYYLNAGLPTEQQINGQDMLNMYHEVFDEVLQIQMDEFKQEIGYDQLLQAMRVPDGAGRAKAVEDARLNILKKLRDLFLSENIKRDRLTDNMEKQLQLVVDESGVDFALPIAFPAYQDEYQNLFYSLFKNRVLKTMMNGKEVVQTASPGGMLTFTNLEGQQETRELKYLDVAEDENGRKRVVHAEVLVNAPILKRLGIKPGDDLSQVPEELLRAVGYRIPHQDKSSTLIMKVVGVLPKSYNKTIIVPGNITVMMGSDFDVDKMFVMFPEFGKESVGVSVPSVKTPTQFSKVTLENYETLSPSEKDQDMRKAALKNRMLEIIEAISASPLHFKESITPLDPTTLREHIRSLDALVAGTGQEIDVERRTFDDPLKEIEMEENYKFSQKLVGVYANILAGLSVASNGTIGTVGGAGVAVAPQKVFRVDGQELGIIRGTESTFKILVEHLSAALDAGKEVLQPQLNDNLETVGSKAFLYGIGMDPELVTMLHRTPMVRDFVKLVTIDGLSPGSAFDNLGIPFETQKLIKQNSSVEAAIPVPMTALSISEGLTAKPGEDGSYADESLDLLKNFAISYFAGKDLQNFFSAITPDVLDGIGDLGRLQSLVETIESFENSNSMFGQESVNQFLIGDSFGVSKSFFNAFSEMMELSSDLFLGATPAVRNFKDQFKHLTGKDFFTPEEHRAMDRALFYWMMTKEGSPLQAMIQPTEAEDPSMFMTNPQLNIVTELQRMREKYPEEVGKNIFVQNLVASTTNESENNRVFNVQFESLDKMDSRLKSSLTKAFKELLDSEESDIRAFAKRLIRHQLMSTGFTPGYGSYYNLIPVEYFIQPMKGQTQSVGQFAKAQIRNAQQDPNYFSGAMGEIIRAIGTRRTSNTPMIPLTQGKFKSNPQKPGYIEIESDAAVIAIRKRKKKVDKVELYAKVGGNEYRLINQTGISGQFNEINTGGNSSVPLLPGAANNRAGEANLDNIPGFKRAHNEAIAKGGKVRSLEVISDRAKKVSIVSRTC